MPVKLNATGGGSVSINPPATTSNFTATMPAATGNVVLDSAAQTLTNKTLTTPNIDSAQVATVSGTAPIYLCRAWVNFNGTGTVAIRASGNVSSITDGGTGTYTVNFTTAMPDANYAVVFGRGAAGIQRTLFYPDGTTYSTTAVRVTAGGSGALDDPDVANVAIFR